MFLHSQFNQPIGEWNVSNVLNMSRLFVSAPDKFGHILFK